MEPIVEVRLPLRSECKCFCHNGGFTHVAPCCRSDPTPTPDLKADNAALVEKLCREYRPTMDRDVLHSWAADIVAALQATEPRP